ncbi:unnamed protein product [Polarella glacialis]|uniref:Uncharacterized protein n=1 Tax=Polarella glacialis TaxID=89957 RepID=A0A813FS48_POLGL|nr:unnamed protein product [Polarella glacialis]CAE8695476.1 unnamed protein product [Polarella glacialis]
MMSKSQHLALLVAGLLYGTSATAAEPSCAEEPDDASLIQSRSSRRSRNLTIEVEELQEAMNNSILGGSSADTCRIGIFRKAQNLECVDVISIFSPTTVYYCKDGNLVFCGKKSDTTCVDFQAPDPCGVAPTTTATATTTLATTTEVDPCSTCWELQTCCKDEAGKHLFCGMGNCPTPITTTPAPPVCARDGETCDDPPRSCCHSRRLCVSRSSEIPGKVCKFALEGDEILRKA